MDNIISKVKKLNPVENEWIVVTVRDGSEVEVQRVNQMLADALKNQDLPPTTKVVVVNDRVDIDTLSEWMEKKEKEDARQESSDSAIEARTTKTDRRTKKAQVNRKSARAKTKRR